MALTNAQKAILDEIGSDEKLVIVNCPPGSGKTLVASEIIKRIQKSRYLVTTFNRKASEELRARSGADKVSNRGNTPSYCSTFHSYCYHFLRDRGLIGKDLDNEIIANFLNELLKEYEDPDKKIGNDDDPLQFSDVSAIDDAKKEMVHIYNMAVLLDQDPLQRFQRFLRGDLEYCQNLPRPSYMFKRFLVEKKRNRWVNFTDTLAMTRNVLQKEDDVFDYIIVDEAQDLDVMQINILRLLMRTVRKQVFLIGDEDQKIYTWRGADHTPLVFWNGKHLPLDESFRIRAKVAEHAKRLIKYNTERIQKDWKAVPGEHDVHFIECNKKQSMYPLEYIENLNKQGTVATILTRTNYPLNQLALELLEKGITVRSSGGFAWGFSKNKGFLPWLEFAQDPEIFDRMDAEERIDYYSRLAKGLYGIGDKKWKKEVNSKKESSYNPELDALKSLAKRRYGVEIHKIWELEDKDQINLISTMVTGKTKNYLAKNVQLIRKANPNFLDAIKNPKLGISTIHRFKGKEDERILIMGVNNKNIPHKKSIDTNYQEERRLLFVAATRSKGDVDVFFNRENPSPFLNEMVKFEVSYT